MHAAPFHRLVAVFAGVGLVIVAAVGMLFDRDLRYLRLDSSYPIAEARPGLLGGAGDVSAVVDPKYPCGTVCIALVSRLLDRPVTLATVRSIVQPDAMGRLSMAQLVRALDTQGFAAAGIRVTPQACEKLTLPLIMHVRESHFAVLLPSESGYAWVFDPPFPPAVLSLDSLQSTWDGASLIVAPSQSELDRALATIGVAAS